jgi:hypothetical protein
MLYQLSYALKPHYQVSTFGRWISGHKQQQRRVLQSAASTGGNQRLSETYAGIPRNLLLGHT